MSEPVFVALLLADKVITENNGKKCVIGTFTTFHALSFPVVFPPWQIYAAVTNLVGKHSFALNLVNEESQVLVPISGDFDVKDLSIVVELDPLITGAVFPKAGTYTLSFFVDGSIMGSRVLKVELKT